MNVKTCALPECSMFGKILASLESHVHDFPEIKPNNGLRVGITFSPPSESYRVPIAVRYDLIPPIVLKALAEVYQEGAITYGDAKYIEKPLPFSNIINHAISHLMLFISGDRSEKHAAKVMWAMASLIVLEDMYIQGLITEDPCDVNIYGAKASDAIRKRNESKTE